MEKKLCVCEVGEWLADAEILLAAIKLTDYRVHISKIYSAGLWLGVPGNLAPVKSFFKNMVKWLPSWLWYNKPVIPKGWVVTLVCH